MKTVSIIIPTLNAGKLLPALFDSISMQNYPDTEVIIYDDARTNDNTTQVITEWKSRLNIKYLKENQLLGQARLDASKSAKGDYLMHIDADMQLKEGLLKECVNLIDEEADAVIIYEEVIGEGFWTKCKALEKQCYKGDDQMESPRFFSKSSYFEVGGHNPKLALSEDRDIAIKYLDSNKKVVRSITGLLHNERKISPIKTFNNKFYWAQTGFEYLNVHPKEAWWQALTLFFRKAYLRNWKLLISHPILTIGMFYLKVMELLGATFGGFGTKIGIVKRRDYKTVK
ncbi:MAG: glycosyltransferase family A protein [Candidatus Dojkabacteria bacterium]